MSSTDRMSRDGAIVPIVFDDYTPADFAKSFRRLADHIESGQVTINRVELTKAGKGGPHWIVNIDLDDLGRTPL